MKLKVIPEDFVVREMARPPVQAAGPYRLYLLEKKGWNTIDLLMRLARTHRLPYRLFAYGGLKDRHAHTFQHVTVRHPADLTTEEQNFALRCIGFMDRPMGPDLLEGNEFVITMRAMGEAEASRISRRVDEVRGFGYPNYYDDQRFGSWDRQMGLMAERLLKKHYNGGLQIYLTGIYPDEKREARERKLFFRQHWGDWAACLARAQTPMENQILSLLAAKPKAYIEALQMIPREELSLHFSAYQGFLFNELLRRVLLDLGLDLAAVAGVAGPYLFYRHLESGELARLKSLVLPLAAGRMEFPDSRSERLFAAILEERGINRGSFNLRKVRQAFFKSTPRNAVVFPGDLRSDHPEPDDLYPGKYKVRLCFKLPRGSYGTMLVKRLTMP